MSIARKRTFVPRTWRGTPWTWAFEPGEYYGTFMVFGRAFAKFQRKEDSDVQVP